jgi:hypothetical protein
MELTRATHSRDMKLPAVVEQALQVQLANDDPNGELFGAAVARLQGDRVALEAAPASLDVEEDAERRGRKVQWLAALGSDLVLVGEVARFAQ